MFYVMYDKTTKQILNWGSSQQWANKNELSNYVIAECEEIYPISPIEYDLRDTCKFDTKKKKIILDSALKLKADKQKQANILIEHKKTELAKKALIAEGTFKPDGSLNE